MGCSGYKCLVFIRQNCFLGKRVLFSFLSVLAYECAVLLLLYICACSCKWDGWSLVCSSDMYMPYSAVYVIVCVLHNWFCNVIEYVIYMVYIVFSNCSKSSFMNAIKKVA